MTWTAMNVYEAAVRYHLLLEAVASDADILALAENSDESVWYAACRIDTDVCGFAIFFDVADEPEDTCLVKVVAETEGPTAFGAPTEILEKLSPTTDHIANEWRKACHRTSLGIPTIQLYSRQ